MMYNNKLAVALKSAGNVLREFNKDEVYVPFGSEYSIFIKNMNSVRALVTVSVDGVDVGDGTRFVVDANDSIDIERFIKNGNFSEGNRLRFIERTGAVERNRGVGIEDGLVRVEFNFEKVYSPPVYSDSWIYKQPYNPPWPPYNPPTIWYTAGGAGNVRTLGSAVSGTVTTSSTTDSSNFVASNSVNVNYVSDVKAVQVSAENDVGITVPGSISDQQFNVASWFPTETETHVIVLKILGQTSENVQVTRPVTVRVKPTCVTCGRTNRATAKFCTDCGTSLNIV